MGATPAGWYPDPHGAPRQRYYDGARWTENYAPVSRPPVAAIKPKSPGATPSAKVILIGMGVAVVLAVVIGFGASVSDKGGSSAPDSNCATVAGSTEKYFCWLRSYGFKVNDETSQSLLVAGSTLCSGLRSGGTPEQGAAVVYRSIPDVTEKQAGLLISAAQFGLCPDTI